LGEGLVMGSQRHGKKGMSYPGGSSWIAWWADLAAAASATFEELKRKKKV